MDLRFHGVRRLPPGLYQCREPTAGRQLCLRSVEFRTVCVQIVRGSLVERLVVCGHRSRSAVQGAAKSAGRNCGACTQRMGRQKTCPLTATGRFARCSIRFRCAYRGSPQVSTVVDQRSALALIEAGRKSPHSMKTQDSDSQHAPTNNTAERRDGNRARRPKQSTKRGKLRYACGSRYPESERF